MKLDRRTFLRQLGGMTLLPLATKLMAQEQRQRFNVMFIAVDDLNRRLNCYGYSEVLSPNVDRLAQRGVLFRRAYCQYPLCNLTRTSFLSGLHPETTRIMDNKTPPRTYLGDIVFLPQHFRQHGYFTARVGKIYHGRMDDAASWDVSEDAPGRGGTRRQERRQQRRQGAAEAGALRWQATENKDEEEPDGGTARRIVQLLEEHVKQRKDQPFFIAAGFHKPHLPWVAPKRYFDLYDPAKIQLPTTPSNDRDDIPPIALTGRRFGKRLTDEQKRQAIAAYYACVSFMDAQVGVILDALDRLKLWGNTVVVFLGDHGFHLGEHGGLWAKMTLFEESAGTPLIIAAPNIKVAGKACQRTVEFVDIYPTPVELCGLPIPKHKLQGKSLVPLLNDPNDEWDKPALTVVRHGEILGRSIRTERWRYTEWGEGREGVELYDHDNDPHEYTNLANDPKYAEVVKDMKRLLRASGRAP